MEEEEDDEDLEEYHFPTLWKIQNSKDFDVAYDSLILTTTRPRCLEFSRKIKKVTHVWLDFDTLMLILIQFYQ